MQVPAQYRSLLLGMTGRRLPRLVSRRGPRLRSVQLLLCQVCNLANATDAPTKLPGSHVCMITCSQVIDDGRAVY